MQYRIAIVLFSGIICSNSIAQEVDSTLSLTLEAVVVTAERSASTVSSSTVGVTKISARDLRMLPIRNSSNVLSLIPGMTFLDFDGLGYAPQTVTRGFYGGGEAEYVILLINGKQVNNVENGLINWDQIIGSPSTVIEVLRGGASSLYGDAAIGAVINVRTAPVENTTKTFRLNAGNLGIMNGRASILSSRYSVAANFGKSDGFRDHSNRSSANLQGSYKLVDQARRSLSVSGSANVRDYDTPGPLRSTDPIEDGSPSLPFFKFDNADEKSFRASVDADWRVDFGKIDVSVTGDLRSLDLIRTLPLSADFADTQERDLMSSGIRANAQMSEVKLPLPIENSLVVGADLYSGNMDSKYYHIETGGLDDYRDATGERGDLLSDGSASRLSGAGYFQLELKPSPGLKISLGGRMDWINDSFEAIDGLSDPLPSASHSAFSPKAGVNYRYVSSGTNVGNVYASASRSFKAPTLDQLYDLRGFPVPFPPYSIQISNADLIPQEGVSYEMGFYHQMYSESGLSAMFTGSVYTIDMINELDFSFETFQNVNIGKSRHQGIESGIRVEKRHLGSVFVNYTLQDVTLQAGDNSGKYVKAIPRHSFSGGVMAEVSQFTAGFVLKGNREMYVDDANTAKIPDYATVDLRLTYTGRIYTVTFDVFNVFDKSYHSTAYPDPAGSETLFLFPAALRTVSLGLDLRL